jgi:predicted amidophosphoribosyltransferase
MPGPKYCAYCGKSMSAEADFCPACGKPIADYNYPYISKNS